MCGAKYNHIIFATSFALVIVGYFDMLLLLFIEFYGSQRIFAGWTLYFVVFPIFLITSSSSVIVL